MSSAPVLSTDPVYEKIQQVRRTRPDYSADELENIYSIDGIADQIITGEFKVPCLQFPDNLVQDSANIASAVEKALQQKGRAMRVYVLADTSYSPCCIDEIAAQHVKSDVLFHFGNACLNPVRNLPVYYVMEKVEIDSDFLMKRLEPVLTSKTILYADTQYTPLALEIKDKFPELSLSLPSRGTFIPAYVSPNSQADELFPNRFTDVSLEEASEYNLIYLSSSEPSASLLLHFSTIVSNINVFDMSQPDVPEVSYRNALQKRYKNVQMARAAGTVGILVNTLSLKYMMDLLERVKKWVRDADKKYYTFVVGKPNVAKLANFEAIDIWVVLGCPLGGIIVDSQDFYRPIVTPHELQMALSDTWQGKWVIDFKETLKLSDPGSEEQFDEELEEKDEDAPYFDPVIGKYVSNSAPLRQVAHIDVGTDENSLVRVSNTLTIKNTTSTAAEFLQSKSWRGLGTEFEETGKNTEEFAELKRGRGGIARDYSVV